MKSIYFIILLLIPLSYGHSDGGEDKVVNGYLVDLGYSPENIRAGESVFLAVNLMNKSSGEIIEADAVWIRISDNEKVLFSGTFKVDKNVALSYNFDKNGEYEITTRFLKSDSIIVETDFLIEVVGGDYVALAISIIALILITFLKFKKINHYY